RVAVAWLGGLDARGGGADVARAYARRALDDDDRERLVGERKKLTGRALDLARFGLEPLVGGALTIAVTGRPRSADIPTADELATLLADFRGAAVAPWPDAAALHIRRSMGFAVRKDLLGRAAGAFLTDAAGLRSGLPWGRGDVDTAGFLAALPDTATRVVQAAPFATDAELRDALAAAAAPGRPPAPAPAPAPAAAPATPRPG